MPIVSFPLRRPSIASSLSGRYRRVCLSTRFLSSGGAAYQAFQSLSQTRTVATLARGALPPHCIDIFTPAEQRSEEPDFVFGGADLHELRWQAEPFQWRHAW